MRELLERQHRYLIELEELLQREKAALLESEVDGELLAHLAASKQPLLEAIETQEGKRVAAHTGLGYDSGEATRAAEEHDCGEIWQEIGRLLRETSHLNQLNGSLIKNRLVHNRRVLRELRQIAGAALYGADGLTRKGTGRVQSSA
ncbi:MAG: flagellar protein FlgN [Pseudohongiellaceae bacterium]